MQIAIVYIVRFRGESTKGERDGDKYLRKEAYTNTSVYTFYMFYTAKKKMRHSISLPSLIQPLLP